LIEEEKNMSFMEAVKSVFSQYAGFSGRARRSEYWYFTLFNFIVTGVFSVLSSVTGSTIFSVLSGLFSLAVLIPGIAVCIRRLHDIGKSGWYLLFVLIPLVGAIILIVWYCKDSMPGENQYGPNPKEVQNPVA
jgi:uncharacterized membrane protein YhaH (DUF805 family)